MEISADQPKAVRSRITLKPSQAEAAVGIGSGKDKVGQTFPFIFQIVAEDQWISFRGLLNKISG